MLYCPKRKWMHIPKIEFKACKNIGKRVFLKLNSKEIKKENLLGAKIYANERNVQRERQNNAYI